MMVSKAGVRFRLVSILTIVILTSVMLTVTWNYGHIQINNLNIVNMYFSIRRYDPLNKTSRTYTDVKADAFTDTEGETQHRNTKSTPNKTASEDEMSDINTQSKELKSDGRRDTSMTPMADSDIRDQKYNIHNLSHHDNSNLNSVTQPGDAEIQILQTLTDKANISRNHTEQIRDENQTALSKDKTIVNHKDKIKSESACVKRLPGCIIFGVQKCGTKALAEFLKAHPNVSLDSRQTYYFSQNYDKGLDWYKDQMACSESHQIVLERTPQYFYYKEVPKRIYNMNEKMKLILIVCDPITRSISNFAMAKDRDREDVHEQFEDCVLGNDCKVNSSCKYVRKSNYQKFMPYWLNVFPLSQIHIVNGDKLKDDPATVLNDVEKFLGIPAYIQKQHFVLNLKTGFKCIRKERTKKPDCLSRKKGRKHPFVKESVVSILQEYFRPRNTKFFKLIGQKFNNW